MRFGVKSLILSLAVVLLANTLLFADTIRLKDGSVLKGKVMNFKDGQFTVLLGDGARTSGRRSQLTVYMEDVEAIEFDGDAGTSANRQTAVSGVNNPIDNTSSTAAANNRPTVTTNDVTNTTTGSENSSAERVQSTDDQRDRANTNNSTGANTDNRTNNTAENNNGLSRVINAQPTTSNTANSSTTRSGNRFLSLNVKVLADATANGWTNASNLTVKKGQRVRISAAGRVSLGAGRFTTPAGIGSLADDGRLLKTEPTGALIAVIGDDNNDFIFIGAAREFVAERDGTLFLGINEGNLDDNSGAFDVTVEAEAVDVAARR